MEKRKCVKTDTIMINMLIHAMREVFREEKERGIPTEETGALLLRLAGYQDKKLYLTDGEYRKCVQALNGLRNTFIQNGRYADGIDAVLVRIIKAKYRTYRNR